MKSKLWIGAVAAAAAVSAALFLAADPASDTLTRYIPMAQAFAAGDTEDAFHPRFGILFPLLSGSLVWLGCSGFLACQLTGLIFFLAAALPLYGIFREFCRRQTALLGVTLYLFCSHLHRIFYAGLRENLKTFAMALLAWGLLVLYRDAKSWKAAIAAGIGCGMLASIRAEGFAFAVCVLLILLGYDIWRRCLRNGRSLTAVLLFLILLLPQLWLNYRWTGYPVPFSGYLRAAAGIGLKAEVPHE